MQKLTKCLLIFSLAFIAAANTAHAGKLELREQKKPSLRARGAFFRFGKIKGVKGLVSKDAKTAVANGIAIAVDKAKADSKEFNVLRVDFTGKGDFTNAATIKLTIQYYRKQQYSRFNWTTVDAKINGKDMKVKMQGGLGRGGYHIRFGAELAGKAKFGKKEYDVTVVDQTQGLKFGVAPKLPLKSTWELYSCNVVYVKTDKGVKKGYLNQPILIGGKWYITKYKNYTLTAEEYKGKLGKVKIDVAKWALDLSGKKYIITVEGTNGQEIEVPAGEYKVSGYYTCLSKDKPGPAIKSYGSTKFSVKIEKDKTTTVPVGTEVVFNLGIRQRNGKLSIGVYPSDGIKSRSIALINEKGKRAPAPKVEIYKDGKLIHTVSMRYG